ncbi:MAG: nucleotide sugar dehydrogenase, partial [Hyphomicrobiales bacterium]
INDGMADYVADEMHGRLKRPGKVLILGVTFKEDVPDLRNSKVMDVIARLAWLGHEVVAHDPHADPAEAMHEYGLTLPDDALAGQYDAVLLAVPHAAYKAMTARDVQALLKSDGLVADLKGAWSALDLEGAAEVWRL